MARCSCPNIAKEMKSIGCVYDSLKGLSVQNEEGIHTIETLKVSGGIKQGCLCMNVCVCVFWCLSVCLSQ